MVFLDEDARGVFTLVLLQKHWLRIQTLDAVDYFSVAHRRSPTERVVLGLNVVHVKSFFTTKQEANKINESTRF